MTDLPIACSLDADELARRQADLRASVLACATSVEDLAQGLRWRFSASADVMSRLGALIDIERGCCRFLRFVLNAEPDLGEVTLEVTGPEGTRAFLASWLPATGAG